jgi:hypothetical protein
MSNAAEFGYDAEQRLVALETVWFRVLCALALLGFLRQNGPLARVRRLLGLLGVASLLGPLAWPAVLCLLAQAAVSWRLLIRCPPLGLGIAVLGSTLLMHAVFFGAGRYALVNGFLAGVLATAGCCTLRRSLPQPGGLAEVWPRS